MFLRQKMILATPAALIAHLALSRALMPSKAYSSQSRIPTILRSGNDFDVLQESRIELIDAITDLDTLEIKSRLLDLLPRMTGSQEEIEIVEAYVNTIENRYTPVQTLDFLNLAMSGDWQLLFSTNLMPGPRKNFRLRELFQRIETDGLDGSLMNEAKWELAEDGVSFLSSGKFTIKCSYNITQGSRMHLTLEDHVIELARGSTVPEDVQGLVGLIRRSMPKELFDPNDHASDITYLDGDLKISRLTGAKFEGTRDIFIRKGSMTVNPF